YKKLTPSKYHENDFEKSASLLDNINSEDITLANEDELELNESTVSDISENLDNLDAKLNSSLSA
ncbi:2615_t:CDS:2, partial [Gigaspora margarita]